LVILIILGIIVVAQIYAQQRRKELAAWASSRGLQFRPSRVYEMGDQYPDFGCLNHGTRRYAENVIRGRIGQRSVCAFDYHYETSNGDHDGSHRFSALIVTTNLPFKPLLIRHEAFLDRVAAFLGFEGIEFESAEFSKEFHVKSPDRRWAFDVLSQATMEFLLRSPRFILEFHPWQVMAYRDETFKPADFESALQVIEGILDRLPKDLLQELQGVDG
jgi:hypothetical protein